MTGEAQFPLERAFVVQLRRDAALPSAVRGRVEHVVSGRACRFETVAELAAFVEQMLRDPSATPPRRDAAAAPNIEEG